jgi:membrane-associated phospholipid phosphatase
MTFTASAGDLWNQEKCNAGLKPNFLDEGRVSFPSGHSSSAMCISLYNVMWVLGGAAGQG